jgi:transcriptional regulator with XRE-family HTH domain
MAAAQPTFGDQLRSWRQLRRMSQMDLALEAEISTRHLSFVESGRARPSRDMVLRLVEQLDVPLRARNALLTAAGLAPAYPERGLDDPSLDAARRAVDLILKGHEPYPALAVDRHWNLVSANAAVAPFLEGVAAELLTPPVNVLRLSLHPQGLAPRILNLAEWKAHLLHRLREQCIASGDPELIRLKEELESYPAPDHRRGGTDYGGILVPMVVDAREGRRLSFFSTTTVFGTPTEVTLSELAIESFFPADAETAALLRAQPSA